MYATNDLASPRARARGLSRSNLRGLPRARRRAALGAVCAAAVALPLLGAATAQAGTAAPSASGWTSLRLLHQWHADGFGTAAPAVKDISGIVHFRGAIKTKGNNAVPFILPAADRPANKVVVAIDLADATAGSLTIMPNGTTTVTAEQGFNEAKGLTSLEGASFAISGKSFSKLRLLHGWSNFASPAASAAVRKTSGIVLFRGLIHTGGSNPEAFILPAAFRPAHLVYVPVALCDANNGRLEIFHNGTVRVEAEGGTFVHAQCETSLDGAWFAQGTSGFSHITLQNGWANYGSGTGKPAVRKIGGIVYLQGAMFTNGNSQQVFTLPSADRPSHYVYVSVDTNGTNRGNLLIGPSGGVTVFGENGNLGNTTPFVSLEGVSFAP